MFWILSTSLTLAMAFAFHLGTARTYAPAGAQRWILSLEKPAAVPPLPSAYDQEAALGPKALLDRWNPLVREAGEKFGVPWMWIRAVMRNESGGRTMLAEGLPIVSIAGAMGGMQLMPDTYGLMAKRYGLGNDPFNARDNVFAAAAYLRWLHDRFGFPGMLAAYNDGPTLWQRHVSHRRPLPRETSNYLKSISSF